MRSSRLVFAALLPCLIVSATAQPLSSGLVAYYSEDETVHTDTLGAYHGTAQGSTDRVAGKIGQAHFYAGNDSGGDSRVRASVPVSTWQQGTVSAWIRPTTYSSGNMQTIWQ